MSRALPTLIDRGPRGGSQPPLVCLHGFLGCAADFSPLCDAIGTSRRVIAFDLPGHGAGPEPLEPICDSFGATVGWIADRLDALGLEQIDLLGYSMGGRLAYGFLDAYQPRVRRAVCVSANPGLEDPEDQARRTVADALLADRIQTGNFDAFLATWYDHELFGRLTQHPGYAEMIERRRRGHPAVLAEALRILSVGTQPSYWEALGAVRIPVLLLGGADDEQYLRVQRSAAAALPRATAVVIPNASHCVPLEQPEAFAAAVREFLNA